MDLFNLNKYDLKGDMNMDLNAKQIIEQIEICIAVSQNIAVEKKKKWDGKIPYIYLKVIIDGYYKDLKEMEEQHDKDCNPNNMENKNGTTNL